MRLLQVSSTLLDGNAGANESYPATRGIDADAEMPSDEVSGEQGGGLESGQVSGREFE